MKKLALILSTLLLGSTFCAASIGSQNIGQHVIQNLKNNTSFKLVKSSYPIIYGGQDISRARIATANESLWAGQPTLIG